MSATYQNEIQDTLRNILSRKQHVTDIDLEEKKGKLEIKFEVLAEPSVDPKRLEKTLERINASGIEYTTKNLSGHNHGFVHIIFNLEDTHDTLLKAHAGLEKAAAKSIADAIKDEAESVPAGRQNDFKKRILERAAEELGVEQKGKSIQRGA